MHIQNGGSWGDLHSALLQHNTVVLRAIDENMLEFIPRNLKRRLPQELASRLVVMRAPQYDRQMGFSKRSGFLITLNINNQQAKSFLLEEET